MLRTGRRGEEFRVRVLVLLVLLGHHVPLVPDRQVLVKFVWKKCMLVDNPVVDVKARIQIQAVLESKAAVPYRLIISEYPGAISFKSNGLIARM